jgi:hypothetical protein
MNNQIERLTKSELLRRIRSEPAAFGKKLPTVM